LEADDFEDTIRNAVSLGGDADTQAAIAGSIASAYWDVPEDIYDDTIECLDHFLLGVLMDFDEKFM
jgi:ADP-ribosylglycohydrolase